MLYLDNRQDRFTIEQHEVLSVINWRNRQISLRSAYKVRARSFPVSNEGRGGVLAMTQTRFRVAPTLTAYSDPVLHPPNGRGNTGEHETTSEKYQLQLRVDEEFFEYLEELGARAGVETTSELIRLSLRELDRVRLQGDGVEFDVVTAIAEGGDHRVVPFRKKTAVRRINVVLRGVAYRRLQRLIEWSGGLPLVELVGIALGVLEYVLTSEEKEIDSRNEASEINATNGGEGMK